MFRAAVRARTFGFDRGLLRGTAVKGLVVISVGNLCLGGSGKTPLAMYLAERLRLLEKRVAVITRGYKGRLESTGKMISDGTGPSVGFEQAGDEACLLAARLSGTSVFVGADRVKSALDARDFGAEVAILDDGFSHRRLYRDLDILLARPADLSPSAALFPVGNLREPPDAAARADLIGGFEDDWTDARPDFTFRHAPVCLVDLHGRVHSFSPPPRRVRLLLGIERPERFFASAREAGFEICGKSIFKDHHRFSNRELQRVFLAARDDGVDAILTTEKDLVRIPQNTYPLPVFALRIETRIVSGQDKLDAALAKLFQI